MKFYYIKIFILFLSLFSYSHAEIVNVFEFTEDELKNLKVRKIKKETSYTTGNNENGNFLKAVSEGTASGLGKEILFLGYPSFAALIKSKALILNLSAFKATSFANANDKSL